MHLSVFKSTFAAASIAVGIVGIGLTPATAMDAACSVKDKQFVCADGSKKRDAIFAALASPATAENIKAAGSNGKLLGSRQDREAYRRSLERARATATDYADRAFKRMKRRKLSLKKYEVIRADYKKALSHYRMALELYHSPDWYDPAKDKNAEGEE